MLYLSDAGHFDNLGVYEMIVRRCRYIVVSDAGYDPASLFEDLAMAVRRARDNLGIPIHFDSPEGNRDAAVSRIKYSRERAAIGRIEYARVDGPGTADGVLIYIKAAFHGDEPEQVYEYAKEAVIFPHHSTRHQSYDVRRFEAYRALGLHSIEVLTQKTSWTLSGWFEHLCPASPVNL